MDIQSSLLPLSSGTVFLAWTFMESLIMSSETDPRWQNYDRFYQHGKSMGASPRRRRTGNYAKRFSDLLSGDRKRSILDVGCADGRLVAFLKRQGFTDVVGVDINEELLARARQNVDAEFVAAHASKFLKSGRQFDIIFLLNVLEHIERDNVFDFMRQIRTALQPGGFAVVVTPNMNNIMAAGNFANDITHCLPLNQHSLEQLARMAGFTDVTMLNQFRMQNPKGKAKAIFSWIIHKWLCWLRGGSKATVFYRNLYAKLST